MKLTYFVQIHLVRRDVQLTKGGSLKLHLNGPKPAKSKKSSKLRLERL